MIHQMWLSNIGLYHHDIHYCWNMCWLSDLLIYWKYIYSLSGFELDLYQSSHTPQPSSAEGDETFNWGLEKVIAD